jgi:hypothetical protein
MNYYLIILFIIIKVEGFHYPYYISCGSSCNILKARDECNEGNKKRYNNKPFTGGPTESKQYINNEIDEDLLDITKLSDLERLQKVIARAGIASRREAEKLV